MGQYSSSIWGGGHIFLTLCRALTLWAALSRAGQLDIWLCLCHSGWKTSASIFVRLPPPPMELYKDADLYLGDNSLHSRIFPWTSISTRPSVSREHPRACKLDQVVLGMPDHCIERPRYYYFDQSDWGNLGDGGDQGDKGDSIMMRIFRVTRVTKVTRATRVMRFIRVTTGYLLHCSLPSGIEQYSPSSSNPIHIKNAPMLLSTSRG